MQPVCVVNYFSTKFYSGQKGLRKPINLGREWRKSEQRVEKHEGKEDDSMSQSSMTVQFLLKLVTLSLSKGDFRSLFFISGFSNFR